MILQCRWLKEQAAADALSFPPENGMHTLRYVHAEGQLEYLAMSPDRFWPEIEIHMYRLWKLTKGPALNNPPYYPYVIRCIDALLHVMRTAARPEESAFGRRSNQWRLIDRWLQGRLHLLLEFRTLEH